MIFSQIFNRARHYFAANDWTEPSRREVEEMKKEGWAFTEYSNSQLSQRPPGHTGWRMETHVIPGAGSFPGSSYSEVISPDGRSISDDAATLEEYLAIRRRIADKVFKPF